MISSDIQEGKCLELPSETESTGVYVTMNEVCQKFTV